LANKDISFEPENDRHAVFSEAEVEVSLVAEAHEAVGGAVAKERFFGTQQVQVHDALCPLV
jgi:hypothetical protein